VEIRHAFPYVGLQRLFTEEGSLDKAADGGAIVLFGEECLLQSELGSKIHNRNRIEEVTVFLDTPIFKKLQLFD
jgi:hypothetical protein